MQHSCTGGESSVEEQLYVIMAAVVSGVAIRA